MQQEVEPADIRRSRPRITRRGAVVLGVAIAALLATALLVRDVVTVRQAVDGARGELQAGLEALFEGESRRALDHIAALGEQVDRAEGATTSPMWWVAEQVPVVDRSFRTTRLAVGAARAATDLAGEILVHLEQLTGPQGESRLRTPDGRIDFAPVREVADGIRSLDLGPLADRLEALAQAPDARLVGRVASGRKEVLDQGQRLLGFAHDARRLAEVLPSFFGADEPRTYFLAMQNPGELRGTGGLIGFFATIGIDEGSLELGDPERYEVLDQTSEQDPDDPDPPLPGGVDPAFIERYGKTGATVFLGNANLDPDLPTVAKVMLDLFERERGRSLDGVIVIDPVGLAFAHAPLGPLTVPRVPSLPRLPNPIPPDQIPRVLMIDAYDVLGGASPQRKDYLAVVAETAFRNVASGAWSAVEMLQRLAQATSGRHLQLYSTRPDEQAVFEELGIAGAMTPEPGQDFLALTANNSAGNKSDVHVGHELRGTIRLEGEPASGRIGRTVELEMAVTNPLGPDGHDIYIVGSSEPGQGFVEAFTGPRGLNRTWFTAWMPETTDDVEVINAAGENFPDPKVTRLHGLHAVDHVLETPARSTRSFGVTWSGTTPVDVGEAGFTYRLRIHRQSKGIQDRLDLRVVVPEGWTVVAAQAHGGGGTQGTFGPHGDPGPIVTAIADGRTVHLTGDATRAVTLELTATPTGA